jgi:hypothetical protein
MNSTYHFNPYIKGTFSGSLECSQAVIFFVVLVGALVVYFVTGKEREREKLCIIK